ncbi:hypothetical protein [Streptomyces erythrochromogenes]|uniref:hypothetical protein n=1 Tax=Streptomyces erythrochromogenes TaxID=285574 RepID=UPI0003013C0C
MAPLGAARTGAHPAVRQFPHGCGGAARRTPEDDFCLALDVLIAGIGKHRGRGHHPLSTAHR